jgi:hypothetical protein
MRDAHACQQTGLSNGYVCLRGQCTLVVSQQGNCRRSCPLAQMQESRPLLHKLESLRRDTISVSDVNICRLCSKSEVVLSDRRVQAFPWLTDTA